MSFQGTSTSSFAQKRFSTIRLPSFRWSRLNARVSRVSVADTRLIGIVTRPKLIEPFHSARGGMSLLRILRPLGPVLSCAARCAAAAISRAQNFVRCDHWRIGRPLHAGFLAGALRALPIRVDVSAGIDGAHHQRSERSCTSALVAFSRSIPTSLRDWMPTIVFFWSWTISLTRCTLVSVGALGCCAAAAQGSVNTLPRARTLHSTYHRQARVARLDGANANRPP